jgi:hypothetical protein
MQRKMSVYRFAALAGFLAASMIPATGSAYASGTCSLRRSADLPEGGVLLSNRSGSAGLFVAQLRRDDDGAPNAYHPCGASYADTVCVNGQYGLDHICNGVSVRDATGAYVPPSEQLPGEDHYSSRRCLETFRAAQAADYPECGRQLACVTSWPGVVLGERNAQPGFQRRVPLMRAGGPYAGYYISQTTLGRADESTPGGEAFLDARRIPYIVVPGQSALTGAPWNFGSTSRPDLALVIAKRSDGTLRAVFAVVGETGPTDETGEVSAAVLQLIRGDLTDERPRPPAIPDPDHPVRFPENATIIVFPHRADSPGVGAWPSRDMSAPEIQTAGRRALELAGGIAQFVSCGNLPDDLSHIEFALP